MRITFVPSVLVAADENDGGHDPDPRARAEADAGLFHQELGCCVAVKGERGRLELEQRSRQQ